MSNPMSNPFEEDESLFISDSPFNFTEDSFFTEDSINDTPEYNIDPLGEEEMGIEIRTKFYGNSCIKLYAYIDSNVANAMTNSGIKVLNVPLELYEDPYMAKLFTSNINTKQLMGFAIFVENIYDELNIGSALYNFF